MRVLIAGLGDNTEFGLASLRRAGHFVGVVDLPHRIPINQCDWWRAGDRFSVDSMLAMARCADFTWDAVLSWEELSTDIAREVAAKLGVATTLADCEALACGAFPVVKPTDHGGSGGVRVAAEQAELADAFEAAASISAGGEVAVDRYVAGTEYGVAAVTWAAGSVEDVMAAMNILNDGAEVYRGE